MVATVCQRGVRRKENDGVGGTGKGEMTVVCLPRSLPTANEGDRLITD